MAQQIKNPSAVQEPQGTWFNPWVRKVPFLEEGMATYPSILAGKTHGQKNPAGYSPWGHKDWTCLNTSLCKMKAIIKRT